MKVFIIVLSAIAFLLFPVLINAETVYDVAKKVRSPDELEKFYANGFRAVFKIPDYYQSPQETLDRKMGDCSDLAELTQAIFKEMGISSEVVVVKFANNKFKHAICVWKEGDYYSYFDVMTLNRTKFAAIQDVMDYTYLNLECCTACKKKLDMETGKCAI